MREHAEAQGHEGEHPDALKAEVPCHGTPPVADRTITGSAGVKRPRVSLDDKCRTARPEAGRSPDRVPGRASWRGPGWSSWSSRAGAPPKVGPFGPTRTRREVRASNSTRRGQEPNHHRDRIKGWGNVGDHLNDGRWRSLRVVPRPVARPAAPHRAARCSPRRTGVPRRAARPSSRTRTGSGAAARWWTSRRVHGGCQAVRLEEVEPALSGTRRAPIYLQVTPGPRAVIPVHQDALLEDLEAVVAHVPIFRIAQWPRSRRRWGALRPMALARCARMGRCSGSRPTARKGKPCPVPSQPC